MSMKTQQIAAKTIISMQECVNNGDSAGFLKLIEKPTLNNCTVGNSYLQEKVISVMHQAIEKFVH